MWADPELEIVCFDCDHVVAVVGDDRDALYLAAEHADATGHRLTVQRYRMGRSTTLWEVTPGKTRAERVEV